MPNDKKVKCPANVVLAVNESGSIDEDLMCDYLHKIIKPYISNASAMLIMDSFKGQTTPKVKDKMNQLELDWLIISPGTNSFLQPCDVSINKHSKEDYVNIGKNGLPMTTTNLKYSLLAAIVKNHLINALSTG